MRRDLQLYTCAALLAAVCLALGSTSSLTRSASAAEQWVQARWQSRSDKTGFPFTPDMHGRVQAQFGYLYSGYTFNNSGMSIQKQQMKPDGSEYQIEGRAGNLVVKRRFRIDPKIAGVRVLEVVHNPGKTALSTTLVVYTQHHWRSQKVVTDTGRNANGALTKGEGGVICQMQGPMQALICYQLCGPRSKVKPTIVNQNNQNLQFHYNFQVPARGTVTLAHGAVVLRNKTMPGGKSLSKLFKELRGRNWVRDLPREIRTSIINAKTRGGFPGDGSIPSLEAAASPRFAQLVVTTNFHCLCLRRQPVLCSPSVKNRRNHGRRRRDGQHSQRV